MILRKLSQIRPNQAHMDLRYRIYDLRTSTRQDDLRSSVKSVEAADGSRSSVWNESGNPQMTPMDADGGTGVRGPMPDWQPAARDSGQGVGYQGPLGFVSLC